MQITHLYEKSEFRPLVSQWIYHEFWQDKAGYSPEYFAALLKNAKSPNRIPLSRLALIDGLPVGTVNLIDNDDEERTHLKPWLAALYVIPEARAQGVGSALVSVCINDAKRLGFHELFLGTDNPHFYQKLGAEHYENTRTDIVIMRFELAHDLTRD